MNNRIRCFVYVYGMKSIGETCAIIYMFITYDIISQERKHCFVVICLLWIMPLTETIGKTLVFNLCGVSMAVPSQVYHRGIPPTV